MLVFAAQKLLGNQQPPHWRVDPSLSVLGWAAVLLTHRAQLPGQQSLVVDQQWHRPNGTA